SSPPSSPVFFKVQAVDALPAPTITGIKAGGADLTPVGGIFYTDKTAAAVTVSTAQGYDGPVLLMAATGGGTPSVAGQADIPPGTGSGTVVINVTLAKGDNTLTAKLVEGAAAGTSQSPSSPPKHVTVVSVAPPRVTGVKNSEFGDIAAPPAD